MSINRIWLDNKVQRFRNKDKKRKLRLKIWFNGRIRRCEFLRIFTYTDDGFN